MALARDDAQRMRRLVACGLLGASLLVCAALIGTLAPRGTWPAAVTAIAGVLAFVAGWPRRAS